MNIPSVLLDEKGFMTAYIKPLNAVKSLWLQFLVKMKM